MKTKHTIALVLSALVSAAASHAATIRVRNMVNSTGTSGESSEGKFSIVHRVGDSSTPPQTLTAKIDGLTLDSDGTDDDSVLLRFEVTTEGQKIRSNTDGWLSSGEGYLDDKEEFVQIRFSSMEVSLSGGGTGSGTFLGFTGGEVGGWDSSGDKIDIIYDGGKFLNRDYDKDRDRSFTLPDDEKSQSLKFLWKGGTVRAANFDYEFTVVPEPTSFALLGALLGGAMFLRRRK